MKQRVPVPGYSSLVGAGLMLALLASPALGQPTPKPPMKTEAPPTTPPRTPPTRPKTGDELKKYDEVITSEAKTQPGVFLVHRLDDKVFFEIPKDAFGKLMLWQIEVAKGPPGSGWGGKSLGSRVVRFERRNNRIFLWNATFEKRADGKAVQKAVDSANLDTIIWSGAVEAEGKDRSSVVQATALFTTDLADFSIKRAVSGASAIDESRSYLESVKAFPTNVEVRSLITFRSGGPTGAPMGAPPRGRGVSLAGSGSATAIIHHSLVQLPEKPMMGRYFDPRVGYFTESFEDYGSDRGWMEKREFITRFRLEKKDPQAAVSEPVKPIVFYLSREIPEKWRPYLKQGVEDWAVAFEKAGFKNAIICKDAPSEREDPNWDPEDARYSVIRWVADPTQNAMGPHVHDPRSGEIISAHIIFWNDIVKLVQQWYFIQCGGSDPRVATLPLPDEITGACLRYVSCHEVGHTLGLRHNHRASQAYSIKDLRNPEFVEKNGTVASIMSYGRFNYVAQPEDKVKSFLPKVAPYDFFAIEWGYKSIKGANTPEEERSTLDSWAARQVNEPNLRFGGEDGPASVDPTVLTENIGDDAIEATGLGLKNLERVLEKLVPATTRLGEDYSLLQDTYRNVMRHRSGWLGAVSKQVGGVVESRTLGRRGGDVFAPVAKEQQQKAVKFLLENAFRTPRGLINPDIVRKFKYVGVADEVMSQQKSLLTSLLGATRMRRLLDAELLTPEKAYTALELMTDVQNGLWDELEGPKPMIDPLRRALQRAYIDHLKTELKPRDASATSIPLIPGREDLADLFNRGESDFRALARSALVELSKKLETALKKDSGDSITQVHLRDCLREVKEILEPAAK